MTMDDETKRQIMHFLVGLVTIALLFHMGKSFMAAAVFFVLMAGMLIINLRIQGMRIGFVEWFVKRFEREDVLFTGFGSACYAAGALIPMVFLTDLNEVAACIFILAVGDGMSTIVGRKGRMPLPYNSKKTAEGSLAFFITSLPAYLFIGPIAIPLAVIGTAVEGMPLVIDDNLTVPIACTALLLVF